MSDIESINLTTNNLKDRDIINKTSKTFFNNPWHKENSLNMEITTIEMNTNNNSSNNSPTNSNSDNSDSSNNYNNNTSNVTAVDNTLMNSTKPRGNSNPFRMDLNGLDSITNHTNKSYVTSSTGTNKYNMKNYYYKFNNSNSFNSLTNCNNASNNSNNININNININNGRRSSVSSIKTNNTIFTNNNAATLAPAIKINLSNISTNSNNSTSITNIMSNTASTSTISSGGSDTGTNTLSHNNTSNNNNISNKENIPIPIPNFVNIPVPIRKSNSTTSMSNLAVPNKSNNAGNTNSSMLFNRSRRNTNTSLMSTQDWVAPQYTILNSIFNDNDIFNSTIFNDTPTIYSTSSSYTYLPSGDIRTLSNDSSNLASNDSTSSKIIKERIIKKYLKAAGFLPIFDIINYDNGNKSVKNGEIKKKDKHHKHHHHHTNRLVKNNGIKISIAKTANHIFLPSISSVEEEYLQRINRSNRNSRNGQRNRSDSMGSMGSNNTTYNNSLFDDGNFEEDESLINSNSYTNSSVRSNNNNFENDLTSLSRMSSLSNSDPEFNEVLMENNSIDNTLHNNNTGTNTSSFRNRSSSMWSYNSIFSATPDFYQQQHNITNSLKFDFDQNSMSYFKLALVVSLEEDCELSAIQLELSSLVNVCFNNNLKLKNNNKSKDKSHSKNTKYVDSNILPENSDEFYKMGSLDWNLNNKNFNLFIPLELTSKDQIIENFNNLRKPKIFKNNTKSKRTELDQKDECSLKNNLFEKLNNTATQNTSFNNDSILKPGDYIFIIPIVFSNNIPESLKYPSIKVDYLIRIATNSMERLESVKKDQTTIENDNKKIVADKKSKENSSLYSLQNSRDTIIDEDLITLHSNGHTNVTSSINNNACNDNGNTNGSNMTLFRKMKDRFQGKQSLDRNNTFDSNSTISVINNYNHNNVTSPDNSSRTIRYNANESQVSTGSTILYDNNDIPSSPSKPFLLRNDSVYSKQSSVDITDPLFPITSIKSKRINKGNSNVVVKKNDIYLEHPLSVVRIPPLSSVSTTNRPVFIDRVWDDTLSYQISFPQKFVTLGSKVPINIKVCPLIKNVSVKKISVGITEKIAYASKDGTRVCKETDHLLKDRFSPYYHTFNNKKKKERLLLLFELRASKIGPRALREEIVTNALGENILAYSRTPGDSKNKKGVSIIEPITIDTTIEFPENDTENQKKCSVPYGIDDYEYISSKNVTPNQDPISVNPNNTNTKKLSFAQSLFGNISRSSNNKEMAKISNESSNEKENDILNDDHRTRINAVDQKDVANYISKTNKAKRGLYLDSSNFHYIKCKHKLTFIMRVERISKDGVLKQYEILVNTPIYLVSNTCSQDNLTLPTYERCGETYYQPKEETLPTFEESINNPIIPSYFQQIAHTKPNMSLVPRSFNSNFVNIDPFISNFRSFKKQRHHNSSTISEDTEFMDQPNAMRETPSTLPPSYRELAVFEDE